MTTLPDGFNPYEHLQSVFMRLHNELVRQEFKEADDNDISTPRSSLKLACLIDDNDNSSIALFRLWLFYVIVRKAADFQGPIYGIPTIDYQSNVKFRPQVCLYFSQDVRSVLKGTSPIRAEVSFRLKNETSYSLTEGELNRLATEIKSEFAAGDGYRWSKGETLVTYRDLDNGLNLQIYALNKSVASALIRKVCNVANVVYDDENLVTHISEKNYPNIPQTRSILGRTRKLPIKRPTAFVVFRRATISVWGISNSILLVAHAAENLKPLKTFT